MNTGEKHFLEQVQKALEAELGKQLNWQISPGGEFDAVFDLDGLRIHAEVKRSITPEHVSKFAKMVGEGRSILLAAPYIAPGIKKAMKSQGINYMDGKGNMYLRTGSIHVFVDGIPNSPPKSGLDSKFITKTGLKVVFQLLGDPENVNLSQRELAKRATVALGNMPAVFKGLNEAGYLKKKSSTANLIVQKEQLVQDWANEYGRRLKPHLFRYRFRSIDPQFATNWEMLEMSQVGIWGGQPGASLLKEEFAPGHFTLYSDLPQTELIKRFKWVPDENGNIEVYETFWDSTDGNPNIPLLIYADLIGGKDQRGLEFAALIYEEYVRAK